MYIEYNGDSKIKSHSFKIINTDRGVGVHLCIPLHYPPVTLPMEGKYFVKEQNNKNGILERPEDR